MHTFRSSLMLVVVSTTTLAFAPVKRTGLLVARPAEAEDDAPAALDDPAAPDDSAARMRAKLKKEAEYPLFFPLLGASAVIGGKGLTDALLTFAKVAAGMRGASLGDTFVRREGWTRKAHKQHPSRDTPAPPTRRATRRRARPAAARSPP